MGEESSLGQLVDRYRRLKRVTIKELCVGTSMTPATYNRILNSRTDMPIETFLEILDFLRVDLNDVQPWINENFLTLPDHKKQIDVLADGVVRNIAPLTQLGALVESLGEAAKDPEAKGQKLVFEYGQLMYAKVAGDFQTAAEAAETLYADLAKCSSWSNFEYALVLPTIGFLPFRLLRRLYADYLAGEGDPTVYGSDHDHMINEIYVAMLANVISTRDAKKVQIVITWFSDRQTSRLNAEFQLYMNFCTCVERWMGGDSQGARQGYAMLQEGIQYFWQGGASVQGQIVARLWQLVAELPRRYRTGGPIESLAHEAERITVNEVGDVIRHFRHAKRISMGYLSSALYLSKSALYRMMSGQVAIKSETFFGAMAVLRLDCADVRTILPEHAETPLAQQKVIIDLLNSVVEWNAPMTTLTNKAAELMASAEQSGNGGFRQLAFWIRIMVSELTHDVEKATYWANELFADLIDYEEWTAFEYSLIITITPYLSFPQAQFLFGKFVEVSQSSVALFPTSFDNDIDSLYLGLLLSAVLQGTSANVAEAASWILNRRLSNANLGFRIYQRFADCVLTYQRDRAAGEAALAHWRVELGHLHLLRDSDANKMFNAIWTVLTQQSASAMN